MNASSIGNGSSYRTSSLSNRLDGLDKVIRCPGIELVIACDDIHRRQRIHEIERVDDLHAVPQLALE